MTPNIESYPRLDIIDHWSDGGVFMASSDLSGRHWKGSIWRYDSSNDLMHKKDIHAQADTTASIGAAATFNKLDVIVGLDTGAIQILTLNKDKSAFDYSHAFVAHECYVTTLSINQDVTRLVSGSNDMSIILWDLQNNIAINKYRYAHFKKVNCLAHKAKANEEFISCGDDRQILLWDTRLDNKPALSLSNESSSLITSLAWSPENDNTFVTGDDMGYLKFTDLRNPAEATGMIQPFSDKQVRKLRFCPTDSDLLAACGNDNKVVVVDSAKQKLCYQNSNHEDLIRGISWDPLKKEFYSCGWDGKVLLHQL